MNEDFKKIAKELGLVLPACLLSIGPVNAATEMSVKNSEGITKCIKTDRSNDVVSHLLAYSTTNPSDMNSPEHTDHHTDAGGNHTDTHSNYSHSDQHSNTPARTVGSQCRPHADTHTNKEGYNRHTNSGNRHHTDQHTNRNYKRDC